MYMVPDSKPSNRHDLPLPSPIMVMVTTPSTWSSLATHWPVTPFHAFTVPSNEQLKTKLPAAVLKLTKPVTAFVWPSPMLFGDGGGINCCCGLVVSFDDDVVIQCWHGAPGCFISHIRIEPSVLHDHSIVSTTINPVISLACPRRFVVKANPPFGFVADAGSNVHNFSEPSMEPLTIFLPLHHE